jgi:trigger factor
MKIAVEELSPVQRKLSIEIPWDTVKEELDQAYQGLQKRARVKGFRAGKVPRKVLEQYYKRTVESEVMQRLIDDGFRKAVDEKDLFPIDRPQVELENEDFELKPELPFRFDAKVDVKPEVELVTYTGIEVKKLVRKVDEAEVETELENLREKATVVESITGRDRVENGDLAVVDFFGYLNGETFKGGKGINYTVEVGAGQMIPGFEEQLIGMKIGEQKTFNLEFPKDAGPEIARGKNVEWKVDLKEIKQKILPELDDEFAKDLGDYESLADLKKSIGENLKTREDAKSKRQLREAAIEKLVELNPVSVPEVMVERQLDFMLNELSQLVKQNKNPEMEAMLKTLRLENRERAEKQVAGMLIIESIAKKEKVEVSDADLDGRLQDLANENRMNVKQVRAQLTRDGRLENLRYDMKQDRALDLVLEQAKVVEEEAPADHDHGHDHDHDHDHDHG